MTGSGLAAATVRRRRQRPLLTPLLGSNSHPHAREMTGRSLGRGQAAPRSGRKGSLVLETAGAQTSGVPGQQRGSLFSPSTTGSPWSQTPPLSETAPPRESLWFPSLVTRNFLSPCPSQLTWTAEVLLQTPLQPYRPPLLTRPSFARHHRNPNAALFPPKLSRRHAVANARTLP